MRTILVTGASKGIGRAIASCLAQDGFNIIVHYLSDLAGAEQTLADILAKGGSGRLLQFDIANREQCKERIGQDIEQHGAYYGIVNNAGIIRDGAFPALSSDDWDRVIHTNLDSFYNVIHPCVMPMIGGAKIYGEIVSFATNCDASHITQPCKETMQVCIEQALTQSKLAKEQIGYISAHGTATARGDIAESHATAAIFGHKTPISSLKSYFGHTLGACGAMEAWLTVEMMHAGWFAPTINLTDPDPECAELDYLTSGGRMIDTEYIQSNNFAFGGINTSLIIRRWS